MVSRAFYRFISLVAVALAVSLCAPAALAAPGDYNKATPAILQEDHLYGEAVVIIDGDTGDILFSKNARVRMYPASTTKIMTLLLAVESGVSMDTVVTIPQEADDIPRSDSSTTPVYAGEITTFGDLLYGMMIPSGNDAANAVAVLLGGSLDAFVQRMNDRAAELGCIGTHFANAHGYHDENHYTTAYDMALIARAAIQYEQVQEICTTLKYTMNVSPRGEIQLATKNSLLKDTSAYYYPECIGVKSGYHSKAGYCFVGAAKRDGVTLVTVTFNCPEDENKFSDTVRMFDYGFTRYTPFTLDQMFEQTRSRLETIRVSNAAADDPLGGVIQPELARISNPDYERMIQTGSEGSISAALDDFLSRCSVSITGNLVAPISAGEIIGEFRYTAQNGEVITASLIADRDIAAQPEEVTVYDVMPFLTIFTNPLVNLLIVVVILLIAVLILHARAKRRRLERRRREIYERRQREMARRERENTRRQRDETLSRRVSRPSTRIPQRTTPRNVSRYGDDDLFGKF